MRSLSKLFLVLATSCYVAGAANAQERPKAIVFDEFGGVSCEDLLSRTDAFFAELDRNPHDVGYVVIYSSGRNPEGFKRIVNAHSYIRKFDRSRLRIVVASDPTYLSGRLWRVPAGAELPAFTERPQRSPDLSRPYRYGRHFDENVCPSIALEEYAQLLKQHPGTTAKIFVFGPDWLNRKQQAETDVNELVNNHGVGRQRIKFFFVHRPKSVLIEAEYWILPVGMK